MSVFICLISGLMLSGLSLVFLGLALGTAIDLRRQFTWGRLGNLIVDLVFGIGSGIFAAMFWYNAGIIFKQC